MITYTVQQPDGSTFPPMSIEEIRKLAREGKITQNHRIQIEGSQTWHPANQILGLIPSNTPEQVSGTSVQNSVKSAGQSAKTQIINRLPILKRMFLSVKETILKSRKSKIISGSCAIVFLIILMVAFGGGAGNTQWHVDQMKSLTADMGESARSGNASTFLDALIEFQVIQLSCIDNYEALTAELKAMENYERVAIANQLLFLKRELKEYLSEAFKPGSLLGKAIMTNPQNLKRIQEAMNETKGIDGTRHPFDELN